jgi:hypothetical protein
LGKIGFGLMKHTIEDVASESEMCCWNAEWSREAYKDVNFQLPEWCEREVESFKHLTGRKYSLVG